MFKKPEDVRMTKEESEAYGRMIGEQSAKFENVEVESEAIVNEESHKRAKLSEKEIIKRVGAQNFENMKDDESMGSINS